MFIHIGDDHVIQSKEVIGIIDYNLVNSSTINEEMLTQLKAKGQVVATDETFAKAVVITTNKVYYSSLSVLTLKKRASMMSTISKLENYSEINDEE
ncbi:OrfX protein [Gracilibacillus boraciitolerans JCM 21714]|uniref:OrfX protein n=1 Tax=Gracilibacillus boraciitolerans JCM 21714 TaxID=1298598 RepID=W4VLX3_9BACI|nr:extracellular matrix/biofilm biosynthesis regulator RemA family protein [Gracilibacillus boraciitolerans]GAE93828.1 OrfX protein [Gracilibacillus boraciitolerans JCM 21714]